MHLNAKVECTVQCSAGLPFRLLYAGIFCLLYQYHWCSTILLWLLLIIEPFRMIWLMRYSVKFLHCRFEMYWFAVFELEINIWHTEGGRVEMSTSSRRCKKASWMEGQRMHHNLNWSIKGNGVNCPRPQLFPVAPESVFFSNDSYHAKMEVVY